MAKGKKVTDFGEIADERINNLLDFSKINSQEDYEREVRKLLKDNPQDRDSKSGVNRSINLLPFVDELYRQSKAPELIANNKASKVKEQEDAFRDALRFERKRKLRERLRDESRTAKNTRPATKSSVRVWKRHPTMGDIRGIDSKLKRRSMVSLITKAGEQKLRDKGVAVVYDVRGFRHFRDMKTGRFSKTRL